MRRSRRPSMTGPALVVAVLALAATTGCVGMPDNGPVHSTDEEVRSPPDVGVERRAQPPQEGDSPQNIVNGFLQAMTAYPVNIQITRDFLAAGEQDAWNPSARIITYQGPYRASGTSAVNVRLDDAHWVDAHGSWRGARGDGKPSLRFDMIQENDEWRIAAAPDAFIVPENWFRDHYTPASVYYLDPTARILVPEPIFVPADQLTSALVHALLDPPGPRLTDVSRSFVPQGLTPGLSVPIDDNGVATITLDGDAGLLTPEAAKLLVYQFAWTLKQDPRLTGFTITIGDEPVTLAEGSTHFSVDLGSEYQPTDVQASSLLFVLRNGLLESGDAGGTAPVAGTFGTTQEGIESVAVSLQAERAAAITGGRSSVLLGSVNDDSMLPVQVVSGATSLLRPAWDFADRLWLVDRTADGARVSIIDTAREETEVVPVTVKGITGAPVKDFLVSRDGTRLVAFIHGRRADTLRVSRIRYTSQGHVLGATRSRNLPWSEGDIQRIRDIGWRSATSVAVLSQLTRDVAQVVSIPVDGSTGQIDRLGLQDRAISLVASPVPNEALYIRTLDGLEDPTGAEGGAKPLPLGVRFIGYAG